MSDAADLKCSYCGSSKSNYRCLVAGPEVYICNVCVGRALQAVLGNQPRLIQGASSSPGTYCAFCGKTERETKRLATTDVAAICDGCLAGAFKILMEGEQALKGAVPFDKGA